MRKTDAEGRRMRTTLLFITTVFSMSAYDGLASNASADEIAVRYPKKSGPWSSIMLLIAGKADVSLVASSDALTGIRIPRSTALIDHMEPHILG
jgi:hypothetical protein